MESESSQDEWSAFDPMSREYYDQASNRYTNESGQNLIVEAPLPPKDEKEQRATRQAKYPYLVVPKSSPYVTEKMLINFFGRALIKEMEFRRLSRVYFVYFENIASLETAQQRVQRYPNLIKCITGRPQKEREITSDPVSSTEPMQTPGPAISATERTPVNRNREVPISTGGQKHPELFRPPLVTKEDYKSGSLLATNDPSQRYLNVKYEFALERHDIYKLKDETRIPQVVLHFRSGRTIPLSTVAVPKEDKTKSLLEDGVSKCVVCQNWTDTFCKLCKMPICDASCFADVAEQHKQACGKGEILNLDEKVGRKYPKPGLPPSGSKVRITAFEQTNVVYVRSADIRIDIAYYTVLTEVMMLGKDASKLQSTPVCGQIVLYKFEGHMSRAMVLNVDDTKDIYVVCIDFGSVEVTQLESLYECSSYLSGLACYPVAVKLRGVPRRFVGPNIREVMYELDQSLIFNIKYSSREYDISKGMQVVVMTEIDINRSLNRLFKTILTPVEPSVSDLGYKEDFLPYIPLHFGKNINVVVMDNTFLNCGFIYCTPIDLAYEVTKMQRDIQEYGEKIAKCAIYAPSINELCIAKYEGKWRRGLSVELIGDGYPSILFIDYGNIVPTHVTDIRPYPPQFIYPIMTTQLDLIGVPEKPTDDQIKWLDKNYPIGTVITCNEITFDEETNSYSTRIEKLKELLSLD
ncbi:protein vreteno [Drosophila sechellia]|uniref:GM23618 n=1 Tax=Drosophila sechellia TaxID=7238 RepID=B4HET5_DROSE|nr:protein vreteno [Drosophila sechellia]EDW43246.1 GM23618 [Drosophila sechellia]